MNNLGEDTVLLANECGNGSIDMSGIATAASLASLAHNMSMMTPTHVMASEFVSPYTHLFVHSAYDNIFPSMGASASGRCVFLKYSVFTVLCFKRE